MISIIIPIYKVEPYLRKCVDSVLAQTFSDFEAILVDDGSPDGCGVICDEYAKLDDRIKVVHQANAGLSAARNAGLSVATGEWITFLDSDDWVNESYLADLLAGVKRGCQVSIALMRMTDGVRELSLVGGELPGMTTPEDVYDKCDLLAVWACGKLFHRDLIGDLRFPVGKIQEDEFFTYQVLFKAPKAAIVQTAVYNYLQRGDSIVGRAWYPERMLAVDGMKAQYDYFVAHDFPVAARHVRKRLVIWLCSTLMSIRGDGRIERSVVDGVKREFEVVLAENQEFINNDPQLRYWVRTVKCPCARRFFQIPYALYLLRMKGVSAVVERLPNFVGRMFGRFRGEGL